MYILNDIIKDFKDLTKDINKGLNNAADKFVDRERLKKYSLDDIKELEEYNKELHSEIYSLNNEIELLKSDRLSLVKRVDEIIKKLNMVSEYIKESDSNNGQLNLAVSTISDIINEVKEIV